MSTHRHFERICCVVLVITLLITLFFINSERFGIKKASSVMGYENKLFDTSFVHTIDIVMDNWEEFTENCQSEEYYSCAVVIDNEAYKNVAIRGKGNTSLTQVASYGNNRYSFKIEFDHYDSGKTYYGLDKLCLNNIIQDNTYMKDYLCYTMMNEIGVATPLCSYVYITVNGEDWGLYLAVEAVEESFLQRNYGKNYGELYKPDSQNMGGGRGNGEKFDINEFFNDNTDEGFENLIDTQKNVSMQNKPFSNGNMQGDKFGSGGTPPEIPNGENSINSAPGNFENNSIPEIGEINPNTDNKGGNSGFGINGSEDVLLKYIDDNIESYSNIFDNAKTDVSDSDKERLIASLKNLNNSENLENTVNIEKVIKYFVVHNFVLNFDSYTGSMIHNYYLYEKDGQMQMIPWDYNLAFGGFQSAGDATSLVNYPIDSPVSGSSTEDRPMLAWIFENDEYTELYHKYFSDFLTEYFYSGNFSEILDDVTAMISPYVEKDPTKFCTYEEFETGVATLKKFCLLRAESIGKQLDGTIGSTSDTQSSDTFIDASDIQITDMGSMNNTIPGKTENKSETDSDFEGNFSNNNSQNQKPEDIGGNDFDFLPSDNNNDNSSTEKSQPDNFGKVENNGNIPEKPDNNFSNNNSQNSFGNGNGNFEPAQNNGQMPNQNLEQNNKSTLNTDGNSSLVQQNVIVLVIVCIAVLLFGLLFATFYKRRN